MAYILGLDLGGVIFYTMSGKFLPGALQGLQIILGSRRFDEIYIVSKVNPISRIIFSWRLWRQNFLDRTGISKDHIYFCRHHKDKAGICKRLRITHFVDDRLQVLHYLESVPHRYALNPQRQREQREYPDVINKVTVATSWEELVPMLLQS